MKTASVVAAISSLLILLACGAKNHDNPKSKQDDATRINSTVNSKPILPPERTKSEHNSCADSISALLKNSNFLDVAGFKGDDWKNQWSNRGRVSSEYDEDGNFVIHAYLQSDGPETGEETIGWFAVNPVKRSFGMVSLEDETKLLPVHCDPLLLSYIIDHCLAPHSK